MKKALAGRLSPRTSLDPGLRLPPVVSQQLSSDRARWLSFSCRSHSLVFAVDQQRCTVIVAPLRVRSHLAELFPRCLRPGGQALQSAPQAPPCFRLQLLAVVPEPQVRGASRASTAVAAHPRRLLPFSSSAQSEPVWSAVRRLPRRHEEPHVDHAAQSLIPAQSGEHQGIRLCWSSSISGTC